MHTNDIISKQTVMKENSEKNPTNKGGEAIFRRKIPKRTRRTRVAKPFSEGKFRKSMNPYPYVLNNPLKYVDPLGLRYEVGTNDKGQQVTERPNGKIINESTGDNLGDCDTCNAPVSSYQGELDLERHIKLTGHFGPVKSNPPTPVWKVKDEVVNKEVNNNVQIGCVEGMSQGKTIEYTIEDFSIIASNIRERVKNEAINYHIEFGVGLAGEAKIPVVGTTANLGVKVTTINWDSGKKEPYMTFGEVAAEVALIRLTEDKAIKMGGEYRNVLGDKNINNFTFLSTDLFEGYDLGISAEGIEEIKKALSEINLYGGASGYLGVGFGVEAGIELVTTVYIIMEEIENYESTKG